jgi:cytidine deaminase
MTPDDQERLIQAALDVRQHCYVPYSGYRVGAALLTPQGQIIAGCNIENAAYSPSICAERTAIFKAISEGRREFVAIAVVTDNAGSPCGVCRQVLFEFAPHLRVFLADGAGQLHAEFELSALLPHGFGPSSLPPR